MHHFDFFKILFFQIKPDILTSEILWGKKNQSRHFLVNIFDASTFSSVVSFLSKLSKQWEPDPLSDHISVSFSRHRKFVKMSTSLPDCLVKLKIPPHTSSWAWAISFSHLFKGLISMYFYWTGLTWEATVDAKQSFPLLGFFEVFYSSEGEPLLLAESGGKLTRGYGLFLFTVWP